MGEDNLIYVELGHNCIFKIYLSFSDFILFRPIIASEHYLETRELDSQFASLFLRRTNFPE